MADKRTNERLGWLRNNKALFIHLPFKESNVRIVMAWMQVAGLYSQNVIWYHTQIRELMYQVRHESKKSK